MCGRRYLYYSHLQLCIIYNYFNAKYYDQLKVQPITRFYFELDNILYNSHTFMCLKKCVMLINVSSGYLNWMSQHGCHNTILDVTTCFSKLMAASGHWTVALLDWQYYHNILHVLTTIKIVKYRIQ